MPCFLWCRCLGGGLWKYLPFRLERPQLLNHQPPARTKDNVGLVAELYQSIFEICNKLVTGEQTIEVFTREVLGAVGVNFLVVVLVAGGERQVGGGVSPQGTLQSAESASFLNLERVLGFLSTQLEGEVDGC